MEVIKKMSAAEMELLHLREIYDLNRSELDAKTSKLDQVMDIINNHIQKVDDVSVKTHDHKIKEISYYTVLAMCSMRKDVEAVIERSE